MKIANTTTATSPKLSFFPIVPFPWSYRSEPIMAGEVLSLPRSEMSPLDEEWLVNGHEFTMSMIPGLYRWIGVEPSSLLFFQDDGSTVVVPAQAEIKTVMHQVSTTHRPYLLHLAGIDGFDLINRILR